MFNPHLASLITHALVGVSLAQAGSRDLRKNWLFFTAVVVCSMLPDIDVIGFRFGVRYSDLWGHRGMTHSLLFAAVVACCVTLAIETRWRLRLRLAVLFFVIIASHGVLDALTDGGLGVAFFSPFDEKRYFFPWRPIHVSPIGVDHLFSGRGLHVLASEIVWIWIPSVLLLLAVWRWRSVKASHTRSASGLA